MPSALLTGIWNNDIVFYVWDFGSENIISASEPVIAHVYVLHGTFNVTLILVSTSLSSTLVDLKVDIYGNELENQTVVIYYIFPGEIVSKRVHSPKKMSQAEEKDPGNKCLSMPLKPHTQKTASLRIPPPTATSKNYAERKNNASKTETSKNRPKTPNTPLQPQNFHKPN